MCNQHTIIIFLMAVIKYSSANSGLLHNTSPQQCKVYPCVSVLVKHANHMFIISVLLSGYICRYTLICYITHPFICSVLVYSLFYFYFILYTGPNFMSTPRESPCTPSTCRINILILILILSG